MWRLVNLALPLGNANHSRCKAMSLNWGNVAIVGCCLLTDVLAYGGLYYAGRAFLRFVGVIL
jgi:predicted HAD superfamily phosphohydrolase YqeG